MTKARDWTLAFGAALMLASASARAADLKAPMALATPEGLGAAIGTISISASPAGAVFKLNLKSLPPGEHGFHVHENGQCGPTMLNNVAIPAGAAGRHWDVDHTNKHMGPEGEGHSGDLPLLIVAADGTATQSLTAPHIKNSDQLRGLAIVIHVSGDNYSDQPAALGGGGSRVACGVIE